MNLFLLCLSVLCQSVPSSSDPLFEIKRLGLRLSPAQQTILLGDTQEAFDVHFQLKYDGAIDSSMRIEASLTGPDKVPHPIDVPASDLKISLGPDLFSGTGLYTLSDVHLTHNGEVLEYAEPRSATVQAVEDILVTSVEVRQLEADDLAELGYIFNPEDYKTIAFDMAMVVGNVEVPVTVPVAYPKKDTSGFQPVVLDDPFGSGVSVKPMMSFPSPTTTYRGRHPVLVPEESKPEYSMLSLLLIPGKFSYLKSHFSVTCVALNTAPESFDVKIERLKAQLKLPKPAEYGFPITTSENPIKDVLHPGADGSFGTADDRNAILPGEEARVEYIVRGEIEGMYTVEVDVTGEVEVPEGTVRVTSVGTGRMLVRTPDFIVTMEHPDAVAEGDAYQLLMHFTNVGEVPLENLAVTLNPNALVGTSLDGSDPTQIAGTLAAGGEATISYNMRASVSGEVIASYFRVKDATGGSLNLTVGVGESGERISKYVVSFPNYFYSTFPSGLTTDLKRYAKKLIDFAQMKPSELPTGIGRLENNARLGINNQFALAAKSVSYGIDSRVAAVQLLSAWTRSFREAPNLDAMRRHLQTSGVLDVEPEFGALLAAELGGLSDEDLLAFLAAESEHVPGLFLALVDSSDAVSFTLTDGAGRVMDSNGAREIPFGALLPLSSQKSLIWCSGLELMPRLDVSASGTDPSASCSFVYSRAEGRRLLSSSPSVSLDEPVAFTFGNNASAQRLQGDLITEISGDAIAPAAFELLSVRQVDPRLDVAADRYGRDLVFVFSKPVDLSSLLPLNQSLRINDEAVVDARLQADGRFVFVSSRMPLGPYKPITYELEGARSSDGQELGFSSGTAVASSWYVGVSTHGRVVDHHGEDLAGTRVFLWQRNVALSKGSGLLLDDITQMLEPIGLAPGASGGSFPWRIFAETTLDGDGSFSFDYVVWPPFLTAQSPYIEKALESFRIGVALPDGRYEVREFWPRGAGEDIRADFAFVHQGKIQGYVTREADLAGDPPVPLANGTVFVVNQLQPQSALIVNTDANGFYQADGIEVGQVLVKSGYGDRVGLASGYLTVANSPLNLDVHIDQSSASLAGSIIFQSAAGDVPVVDAFVGLLVDGTLYPVANGFSYGIPHTAGDRTSADGSYLIENVPAGQAQLVVYHPQYGKAAQWINLLDGEQRTGQNHYFQQIHRDGGSIAGFVRNGSGNPIAGALVGGPDTVVETDASGAFSMDHLPLNASIELLAIAPNGNEGSATVYLDEASPNVTGTVITISTGVWVTGQVLDADGAPVPFVAVRKSVIEPVGDFSVTDANGFFQGYLSSQYTDTSHTFNIVNPPFIAHASKLITTAGPNHVVLQQGRIRNLDVKLVDSFGNPVVAQVNLEHTVSSSQPNMLGMPSTRTTGKITQSDGIAHFANITTGTIRIGAESVLLGEIPIADHVLPDPDGSGDYLLTLAFPDVTLANLRGVIYDVDGVSPAPEGTVVQAVFDGVVATANTDSNGNYVFSSLVETSTRHNVRLTAYHRDNDFFVEDWIQLNQDLRLRHDMTLRGKGNIQVSVLAADGTPAEVAAVKLSTIQMVETTNAQGESVMTLTAVTSVEQITLDQPTVSFNGIPTGPFYLKAVSGHGLVGTRNYAIPATGGDLDVAIRLEATSRISGIFLDGADAPLGDAEVQLQRNGKLLEQQLTDSNPGNEGAFLFDELPMRAYSLVGTDPTTGLVGTAEVTTSPYNDDVSVTLQLDPVGHIEGLTYVDGVAAPNMKVVLTAYRFKLVTASDSEGRFRFENLRHRKYKLHASSQDLPTHAYAEVVVDTAGAVHTRDLHFAPARDVQLLVLAADQTPAQRVLVNLEKVGFGESAFSDESGIVHFYDVPPGRFWIESSDPAELTTLDASLYINSQSPDLVEKTVTFDGWGTVFGRVATSLGYAPSGQVNVTVKWGPRNAYTVTVDEEGYFRLGRIPLNRNVKLSAVNPETLEFASETVTLSSHHQELEQDLIFRSKTHMSGLVTFQDGTPAANARVWVNDPVTREVNADASGFFLIDPVLEGTVTVYAEDLSSPRRAATSVTAFIEDGILAPVRDVSLVLGGMGSLVGSVVFHDGAAVTSGTVSLSGLDNQLSRETSILADGSWRFQDVPLGDYTLIAYDANLAREVELSPVSLSVDGLEVDQQIAFPTSYTLYGLVYGADALPVEDALVELYRADSKGRYHRIYSAFTNDQGAYVIDRVFPDYYQLRASDAQVAGVYSENMTMAGTDQERNITLRQNSDLVGVLQDTAGQPFTSGVVSLTQAGRTFRTGVAGDGSYRFDDLQPLPYDLSFNLAGGWVTGSGSGTLVAGVNSHPMTFAETVSLSGQAVYQGDGQKQLEAWLILGGIGRRLSLDASGQFITDLVPTGQALTLQLVRGGLKREYPVGPFSADTDMGTYYLDGVAPSLSFASPGEGGSISSLPLELAVDILEDDASSSIDTARTRVWLNGTEISADFTTTQTRVSANYDLFPPYMVRGTNSLDVKVFNASGKYAQQSFSFDVSFTGTMVIADLLHLGSSVIGDLRLDGDWVASDNSGRAIFTVPSGTYTLKGRSGNVGARAELAITDQLSIWSVVELYPYGDYRGRVYDSNGNPAAGVSLESHKGYTAITDANGDYILDYLPLGKHHLVARGSNQLGFSTPTELNIPQHVRLGSDLHMVGKGVVEGYVTDGAAVPGASVTLIYVDMPNLPDFISLATVADAAGYYRFEDVWGFDLQLKGYENANYTGQSGRVLADGPNGSTVQVDIPLVARLNLYGTLVTPDGQPAVGAVVTYKDETTVSDETGAFRLEGLERDSNFHWLEASSLADNAILRKSVLATSSERDVGTLQMVPNQVPTYSQLHFPNPYDPRNPFSFSVWFSDDFGLESAELTLGGLFEATYEVPLSGLGQRVYFPVSLPEDLGQGELTWEYRASDVLGAVTTNSGSITVIHDLSGPQLTISQPSPGYIMHEGQSFPMVVSATDAQGVAGIEVYLDGLLMAQTTNDSATFTLFAPAVEEQSSVTYEVVATDDLGQLTVVWFETVVRPIESNGGPSALFTHLLDGMPAPLSLDQGLRLALDVAAEDPDGLDRFELYVEGISIDSGPIFGSSFEKAQPFTVPESLRSLDSLNITLHVWDLGGNETIETVTLQNVTGTVLAADTLITGFDSTYDGQTLVLADGTFTIDGAHQFTGLILANDAVLTQSATTADETLVAGTSLTVDGPVAIHHGASIAMDGKGFQDLPSGMPTSNAGVFAGLAMDGTSEDIYGSPFQPILPGSQNGGGAVKLDISGSLHVMGMITATCAQGGGNYVDGSGGSVWIIAPEVLGNGRISANAPHITRDAHGFYAPGQKPINRGSGGRIAIEGNSSSFSGQISAFGSYDAGAGTIYLRVPDAAKPDGYSDRMILANHPDTTKTKATILPSLDGLVVGTDLARATTNVNGYPRDMITLTTLSVPQPRRYVGMRIAKPGDYALSAPIESHGEIQFLAPQDQTFAPFVDGESVDISWQLDEIVVRDNAIFHAQDHLPDALVYLEGGVLQNNGNQMDITSVLTAHSGEAGLIGDFRLNQLTLDGTTQFQVLGTLSVVDFQQQAGIFELDGHLKADNSLTIAASALLRAPLYRYDAEVHLEAPTMTIAGEVSADVNGQNRALGPGIWASHGGLGTGGTATFGSLYRPTSHGMTIAPDYQANYAGGHIQLTFSQLTLDGALDVQPDEVTDSRGSGGSVLLQGTSMSGSGQIMAGGGGRKGTTSHWDGAGGRVAVLVDDISGFTGPLTAEGTQVFASSAPVGAGTIFFRTADWPLGKLVADNLGLVATDGSTLLPGLGVRTATVATGEGPVIEGENFPDNLEGLYVEVPGHEPVLIASNTATQLVAADGFDFPALAIGDTYSGLHQLNHLEVVNGARLSSPDRFKITGDLVLDGGAIDVADLEYGDVFTDGSGELFTDPGFSDLTLDNYSLTVHFPMDLTHLELRNGARLIHHGKLNVNGDITLDTSTLESGVDTTAWSITAANLTLSNGSLWTVADRMSDGRAYPLRGDITGTLSVDATSTIQSGGPGKGPNSDLPWLDGTFGHYSHGGFGQIRDNAVDPVMGSFAEPTLPGNKYGGGVVRLRTTTLTLAGQIGADGHTDGSGGSVWLEASTITGTGSLTAAPGDSSLGSYSGGGRIAVYYGSDRSFVDTVTFDLASQNPTDGFNRISGAGTVYLKGNSDIHGELLLDQRAALSIGSDNIDGRFGLSGITGPAAITLALEDDDPSPTVIRDLSRLDLPPGMAGLYARFDVAGTEYFTRVTGNDHNSFTLADNVPAVVPAGTEISFELHLDRVTLRNGGQLFFDGLVSIGDLQLSGTYLNGFYCGDLIGLPSPLVLQDQSFRLMVEDGDFSTTDFQLTNASLYTDLPLKARDMTLINSHIRHGYYQQNYSTFKPSIDIEARTITLDGISTFDATRRENASSYRNFGGFGSVGASIDDIVGNLFHPESVKMYTSIRLVADQLVNGHLSAEGDTGGAILMDIGTLGGDTVVSTSSNNLGGGGRIALYYDVDQSTSLALGAKGSISSGTIFVKDNAEPHGKLTIENGTSSNTGNLYHWTPIPTVASHTLAAGDFSTSFADGQTTLVVQGLSVNEDYRDYYLVIDNDHINVYPVITSDANGGNGRLIVSGDLSSLSAGQTLKLGLWLEEVTLDDKVTFGTDDLFLIDPTAPILTEPEVTSVLPELQPGESFTVTFSASDNLAMVEGSSSFDGQSQTQTGIGPYSFTFTAPVSAGTYTFTASATNLAGVTGTQSLELTVAELDTTAPAITIHQPTSPFSIDMNTDFDLQVSALDDRQVERLEISYTDQVYSLTLTSTDQDQIQTVSLRSPQVGADQVDTLTIQAFDLVGNHATATLDVTTRHVSASSLLPAPVSYWSLDDNRLDGDRVIDGMRRNDGTLQGALTSQPGIAGEAFHFTDDWVTIPHSDSLDLTGPITLQLWAKPDNFSDSYARLLLKTRQGNPSPRQLFGIYQNNQTGQMRAQVTGVSSNGITNTDNKAIPVGSWSHVCLTYDGTTMRLYIDGQLESETAYGGGLLDEVSDLFIGADGHYGDNYFHGYLDEVAIWNQSLTPDLITYLYGEGLAGRNLDVSVPDSVTDLAAWPLPAGLRVTWTPSADSDGDLAGYELVFSDGRDPILLPGTASEYSFNDLNPLTSYSLTFRAYDTDGNFGPVQTLEATTYPLDPAILSAPVAYWTFDDLDLDGLTLADAMNQHPGTLDGYTTGAYPTTGQPGVSGQSFAFDGHFVEIPHSPELDMTNALTLQLWAKINNLSDAWAQLLSKGRTTDSDPRTLFAILQNSNSGVMSGHLLSDGGDQRVDTPTPLPLDQWQHLALTYDGTVIRLYQNGKEVAQVPYTQQIRTEVTSLFIGADGQHKRDYFRGAIDEVAIWDEALSPEEILLYYNHNRNGSILPVDHISPVIENVVVGPLVEGKLAAGQPFQINCDIQENTTIAALSATFAGVSFSATGEGPAFQFDAVAPAAEADVVHTLTLSATDRFGNVTDWTADYTVTPSASVVLPPSVTITSPTAGDVDMLAPITVEVSAAGSNLDTLSVAFNGETQTVSDPVVDQSYSFQIWAPAVDSTTIYTVTATATNLSNESDTQTVDITVQPRELDGFLPRPLAYWSLDSADTVDGLPSDLMQRLQPEENTATTGSGLIDEALVFDNKHRVNVPSNPLLDTTDALTYATWVKLEQIGDGDGLIVTGADAQTHLSLRVRVDGEAQFSLGTDETEVNTGLGQPIDVGQWYHVVGSFDNGLLKIYVDGQLQNSLTQTTTALPIITGNNLFLGLDHPGINQYLDGSLDEVAIWSEALTDNQVEQLYQLGVAGKSLHEFRAPSKPTIETVSSTEATIDVSWTTPVHAANLTGYRLSIEGQSIDVSPTTLSHQFTGLTPATLYNLTIQPLGVDSEAFAGTVHHVATMPVDQLTLPTPLAYLSLDSADFDAGGSPLDRMENLEATLNSATMTTGYRGEGLAFYNAEQVRFATNPSIDLTDQITYATWVKVDTFEHGDGFMTTGNSSSVHLSLQANTTNGNRFQLNYNGNHLETPQVESQQWYHLAATYNAGAVSLFLDGQLVATANHAPGALDVPSGNYLSLGLDHPGNSQFLDGAVDEVAIWDQALSHAQLYAYYQRTKQGLPLLDDVTPPGIATFSLDPNPVTSGQDYTVTLVGADNHGVHSTNLEIEGIQYSFQGSGPHVLQLTAPANPNVNPMPVTATVTDFSGLTTTSTLYLDIQGDSGAPVIEIISPADGYSADLLTSFTVEIRATDNIDLQTLEVAFAGANYPIADPVNGQSYTLQLNMPMVTTDTVLPLQVTATDSLGNTSTATRNLTARHVPYDDLAPQPLSYWSLDDQDIEAGVVIDFMGDNHSDSNSATTGQVGQVGESFDYLNSKATNFSSATNLDITDQLSYAAWVKLKSFENQDGMIVTGNPDDIHFAIMVQNSGGLGFNVATDGTLIPYTFAAETDRWYHVAGTFSAGEMKLYVDGLPVASGTHSNTTLTVPSGNYMNLGVRHPGTNKYLNGYLDEPAIWDVALSDREVANLYQMGRIGQSLRHLKAPEAVNVTVNPTADAFELNWSPSADSEGDLAGYRVYLDDSLAATLPANQTTYQISGLSPSTFYKVRVDTYDQPGNQGKGRALDVATLPNTEPVPFTYFSLDDADLSVSVPTDTMNNLYVNTNTAVSGVTGIRNEAFEFKDHEVVYMDPTPAANVTDNITYSAWVYFHAISDGDSLITAGEGSTTQFSLRTDTSSGKRLEFAFGSGILRSEPVSMNRWYQVTATFASGEVKLYLDGVLHKQTTHSETSVAVPSNNYLSLGVEHPNSLQYLDGLLDEVAIWHTALTPELVNAYYHKTLAGQPIAVGNTLGGSKAPIVEFPLSGIEEVTELTGEELELENWKTEGALYLTNTHLKIKGRLQARAIYLRKGSVLTVAPGAEAMAVVAEEVLEIDPTSRINLDGVAQPQQAEQIYPSHGGLATGMELETLYDSPLYPSLPGGGEAGGGVLILKTGELHLHGVISARGLGYSSGGSIWIETRDLSGPGTIDASGGNQLDQHGGGGRVAIHTGTRHRFTGKVNMGIGDHAGSLLLINNDSPYPIVARDWPMTREAPKQLLPELTIESQQMTRLGINHRGVLLEIQVETDLRAYTGYWLADREEDIRILDVIELSEDRYLLQLSVDYHPDEKPLTLEMRRANPQ